MLDPNYPNPLNIAQALGCIRTLIEDDVAFDEATTERIHQVLPSLLSYDDKDVINAAFSVLQKIPNPTQEDLDAVIPSLEANLFK